MTPIAAAGSASRPGGPEGGGPLLEVRDLHTLFDTPRGIVRAVDGVSIAVDRGRTLGIVGESGSGKTVLSRSVMNLLPKRAALPADGEILFEERDLRALTNKQMREYWGPQLAMVFQDPMTSLNPVVKIGRQITEALREHLDLGRKEAQVQAVDLLRSVGIPAPERRLAEYPHQLSGGMRQRVTIAIALSCSPKLLLADEPTTALDVTVQAQILDLLARQQQERHMSMVLVTHDLGVVANRTDEIAVMYAGQIVEKAPTRTLFRSMRHPYTEALMRSIPRIENPSHTRLDAIPGRPPDLAKLPVGCRFAPRCANAQPRCLEENPPLFTDDEPRHEFRCFFPVGTPAGDEARQRNARAGRTAAGIDMSTLTKASA
ncbi:ABC transporter ATP-binding protein [Blastococcus xanthinilyticus]|uniref:Peptide/nickel transport system ATP-binding protein n=1 Tax=Blastococcus xanthinilyticus TaxID=1564164 RepID=A0A5S5D5T8_9ACTN|nr:ABC transporter ATP-binding protein [Blastococcus xanthinilyticus]TYP90506.1 peptide/nickel transport system ATP-binding protein [Blastococcus xanthinilyticus]